ncbi:hypothetical protein C8R44DRAFT_883942 [Mycena epipterygia]|nr:hypothetical protein C8R44DRAFT_883942 [Mycena epipterygia]
MDPTTSFTKTSTKSSRSFSIAPIILRLDGDSEHDDSPPPTPSPARRITTRPLRRKKHLSIYRVSAPAQSPVTQVSFDIPSVQRPQSMVSSPSSVVYDPVPLPYPYPSTKPLMHSRCHSQPNIRLGHSSRPYYSAIRKNMSRPNSPLGNSSPPPSRPASVALPISQPPPMSFGYLPQALDDTEDDDDDDAFLSPVISPRPSSSRFSFGLGRFNSPASALHSGFSVSGEMEMRMALATLAREARLQHSGFQFQETGKMHDAVGWRVRKLGKGLKDLVRRKHTSQ